MRSDDSRSKNLLLRLFSYTPRKGRKPLEDFCTEALAWCLINSTDFQKRFFKLLGFHGFENSDVWIDTQHGFKSGRKGGRFDLLIGCKERKFVIAVECKVQAQFSNQLERYQKALKEHYGKYNRPLLATLTRFKEKQEKLDASITWDSVCKQLNETKDSNLEEPTRIGFAYFTEFLKEKGLGPMNFRFPDTLPTEMSQVVYLLDDCQRVLQTLKMRKAGKVTIDWKGDYAKWDRNDEPGHSSFGYYCKNGRISWLGFIFNPSEKTISMSVEMPTSLSADQAKEFSKKSKTPEFLVDHYTTDRDKVVVYFFETISNKFNGHPELIQQWFLNTIATWDSKLRQWEKN